MCLNVDDVRIVRVVGDSIVRQTVYERHVDAAVAEKARDADDIAEMFHQYMDYTIRRRQFSPHRCARS